MHQGYFVTCVSSPYKSAFSNKNISDMFPRLIKRCHQNAICSSLLLVRLPFSFTLSNICPRGDFSLSLIQQMVKVEHRTKTTPSRGSSHFTTYHIVSLFISLRSKSPVCGEKYAAFKKNTLGEARKESRQTGIFHQLPFQFMCHWVSAAQTELKISGFL